METSDHRHLDANKTFRFGGGGWIRTSVRVSGQIYSLLPLTTRPPLRSEPATIAHDFFSAKVFREREAQSPTSHPHHIAATHNEPHNKQDRPKTREALASPQKQYQFGSKQTN